MHFIEESTCRFWYVRRFLSQSPMNIDGYIIYKCGLKSFPKAYVLIGLTGWYQSLWEAELGGQSSWSGDALEGEPSLFILFSFLEVSDFSLPRVSGCTLAMVSCLTQVHRNQPNLDWTPKTVSQSKHMLSLTLLSQTFSIAMETWLIKTYTHSINKVKFS